MTGKLLYDIYTEKLRLQGIFGASHWYNLTSSQQRAWEALAVEVMAVVQGIVLA